MNLFFFSLSRLVLLFYFVVEEGLTPQNLTVYPFRRTAKSDYFCYCLFSDKALCLFSLYFKGGPTNA